MSKLLIKHSTFLYVREYVTKEKLVTHNMDVNFCIEVLNINVL
jgi:hypothetical protein